MLSFAFNWQCEQKSYRTKFACGKILWWWKTAIGSKEGFFRKT